MDFNGFQNILTLPVRGSRFCGCEGGGGFQSPPRNQWWNNMSYYVAKDKLFIDRFRDCMQKKIDENLKIGWVMGIWKNIPTQLKKIAATQKYTPFGQNSIFFHLVFCKHPLFTYIIEFKNKKVGSYAARGVIFSGCPP